MLESVPCPTFRCITNSITFVNQTCETGGRIQAIPHHTPFEVYITVNIAELRESEQKLRMVSEQ